MVLRVYVKITINENKSPKKINKIGAVKLIYESIFCLSPDFSQVNVWYIILGNLLYFFY